VLSLVCRSFKVSVGFFRFEYYKLKLLSNDISEDGVTPSSRYSLLSRAGRGLGETVMNQPTEKIVGGERLP